MHPNIPSIVKALELAIELLDTHEHDDYETHVALRVLRTIGEIEQVLPSRKVAWKMGPASVEAADAPASRPASFRARTQFTPAPGSDEASPKTKGGRRRRSVAGSSPKRSSLRRQSTKRLPDGTAAAQGPNRTTRTGRQVAMCAPDIAQLSTSAAHVPIRNSRPPYTNQFV